MSSQSKGCTCQHAEGLQEPHLQRVAAAAKGLDRQFCTALYLCGPQGRKRRRGIPIQPGIGPCGIARCGLDVQMLDARECLRARFTVDALSVLDASGLDAKMGAWMQPTGCQARVTPQACACTCSSHARKQSTVMLAGRQ